MGPNNYLVLCIAITATLLPLTGPSELMIAAAAFRQKLKVSE